MFKYVGSSGLPSYFTRGNCSGELWNSDAPNWRGRTQIIFHPNEQNARLLASFKIDANRVDRAQIDEISTGVRITFGFDWINGFVSMPLPPASMVNADEWRMWTNDPALNEFGYFYVALHLAGNYARYFPDKWLNDVETSNPLA